MESSGLAESNSSGDSHSTTVNQAHSILYYF